VVHHDLRDLLQLLGERLGVDVVDLQQRQQLLVALGVRDEQVGELRERGRASESSLRSARSSRSNSAWSPRMRSTTSSVSTAPAPRSIRSVLAMLGSLTLGGGGRTDAPGAPRPHTRDRAEGLPWRHHG
jgi:hypothetical protein